MMTDVGLTYLLSRSAGLTFLHSLPGIISPSYVWYVQLFGTLVRFQ